MKEIVELAYAKINLSLNVTARRANGYHEVDGVMQSVSLFDEVAVSLSEESGSNVTLAVEGNPNVPTDGSNLAVRAAKLLLEAVGERRSVKIRLIKRIPMAGGLAGGSTDAAAVLRACNRLLGAPLDRDALCALGARLGADIPFCVVGGAMRARGIGELLTPVPSMPDCALVVAKMGEGVSTPEAYSALDRRYGSFNGSVACPDSRLPRLLEALEANDLKGCCEGFYNLFEEVTEPVRPCVTLLKARMLEMGAMAAMMSGSGPSVFGVFENEEAALRAGEALRELGADAHGCRPMRG